MATAIDEKRTAVEALCAKHHVQELYLFGSATGTSFKRDESDYDFLVRFLPCTPVQHADRYFGLLEDLQDLFEASIDLVEIDAIRNSRFRQEAEESRVQIYAA